MNSFQAVYKIGLCLGASLAIGGCIEPIQINAKVTIDHNVVHTVKNTGAANSPLTIADAKEAGLIGESYDGYLDFVIEDVTPELVRLVETENLDRYQKYQELGDSGLGFTVDEIEVTNGARILEQEPSGAFIFTQDNGWTQK